METRIGCFAVFKCDGTAFRVFFANILPSTREKFGDIFLSKVGEAGKLPVLPRTPCAPPPYGIYCQARETGTSLTREN